MLVGAADDVGPGLRLEGAGDPDELQAVLRRQDRAGDADACSTAASRTIASSGRRPAIATLPGRTEAGYRVPRRDPSAAAAA